MRPPRCTMTAEERERADFRLERTAEILEEAKRAFPKYIFYDSMGTKNYRSYFCPECGHFECWKYSNADIYANDPFLCKHGDEIECPNCGTEGTLLCAGRMRNYSSISKREEKLLIFTERDGDLTVSACFGRMEYSDEDMNPYPTLEAVKQYFIRRDGKTCCRRKGSWKWFDGLRQYGRNWEWVNTFSEPWPQTHYYGCYITDGNSHVINIDAIYQNPALKYSQLQEMFRREYGGELEPEEPCRGVMLYLGEYLRRPQLEMLVKLGHTDVIDEYLNGKLAANAVDWRAKKPQDFFRMDKRTYDRFRRGGCTLKEYRQWKNSDVMCSFDRFMDIKDLFDNQTENFLRAFGQTEHLEQAVEYFRQQTKNEKLAAVFKLWQDTMNMEALLGNTTNWKSVMFPESLPERHEECVRLVAEQKKLTDQMARQEYSRKRYRQLKAIYAYEDEGLCIRIPTCEQEIKREGALLKHCVAGYAERHIKGIKTILFLRWTDDRETPYITVEMDRNRIVQIHGYRNEGNKGVMKPKEIHGEWLERWQEWLKAGSPRQRNGKPQHINKIIKEKTA